MVDLTLPAGWNGELPEAVHAKSAFALCDTTYRLDGPINGTPPRVFHGERRLTVLQAKVPVTNWPAYKKWYEEAEAGSVPYLQLVRVSAGSNRIPIRNLPITGWSRR